MSDCETNGHIWDGRVGRDFSCEKCGAPYAPNPRMKQKTVLFGTAKDIADLACDLTDKAVYWRERCKRAEADLAALSSQPPTASTSDVREAVVAWLHAHDASALSPDDADLEAVEMEQIEDIRAALSAQPPADGGEGA